MTTFWSLALIATVVVVGLGFGVWQVWRSRILRISQDAGQVFVPATFSNPPPEENPAVDPQSRFWGLFDGLGPEAEHRREGGRFNTREGERFTISYRGDLMVIVVAATKDAGTVQRFVCSRNEGIAVIQETKLSPGPIDRWQAQNSDRQGLCLAPSDAISRLAMQLHDGYRVEVWQ